MKFGLQTGIIGRNAKGFVAVGLNARGAIAIGHFSVGALSVGKYFACGDHAQAMIALADSEASGTVFQKIGELSAQDITAVKQSLDTVVPSYLSWAKEMIKLFWTFRIPWGWTYSGSIFPDWVAQFSFGFYSLMLTSLLIGLIVMIFFKPRTWCAFCPMRTMTQQSAN